jgi:hypothetical protein
LLENHTDFGLSPVTSQLSSWWPSTANDFGTSTDINLQMKRNFVVSDGVQTLTLGQGQTQTLKTGAHGTIMQKTA